MKSRRSFIQSLLATTLTGRDLFAARSSASSQAFRRNYRADAIILLFSLPVYTREGVGGGFVTSKSRNDKTAWIESIQFAAGSDPARTRGLNRLGFLEETVRMEDGRVARSSYQGFMTASGEENFDQAKKALESRSDTLAYLGIEGSIQAGMASSRSVRFETPSHWNWNTFSDLYAAAEERMRASGAGPPIPLELNELPSGEPPTSFLHAILRTMQDPAIHAEGYFVYGGGRHQLQTEKRPDPKMGRRLAQRNLTSRPDRLIAIHGRVRASKTGQSTKFRLWYEDGAANPLPLRFEFQPKSFLALSFEAVG